MPPWFGMLIYVSNGSGSPWSLVLFCLNPWTGVQSIGSWNSAHSCPCCVHCIKPPANLFGRVRVVHFTTHPAGCVFSWGSLKILLCRKTTVVSQLLDDGVACIHTWLLRQIHCRISIQPETELKSSVFLPLCFVVVLISWSVLCFACPSKGVVPGSLAEILCWPCRYGLIFLVVFPVTELGTQPVEGPSS